MPENFRPIPGDPGAEEAMRIFDANADNWLLADGGHYQTAAAETMKNDGSGFQRVVILEYPARKNHTDEKVTVRLMIHPMDALGLAEVLAHTASWMLGINDD
jgi:hypothetical protein